MQVGIIHTIVGSEDLAESFSRAAKAGADGLEAVYRGSLVKRLGTPGDHAKELAKLAKANKLAIPSLSLNFMCDERRLVGGDADVPRALGLIANAIAVAAEVGAGVVLLPFFGRNIMELPDDIDKVAGSLGEVVEAAEDAGVVLGIESTLNFAQMQYLLSALGNSDSAKVYYDTGNALARKLDPAGGLRELGRGMVGQVHFKDVHIEEGSPPDFGVALGKGSVDFHAVARSLRAIEYDGWVILETATRGDLKEVRADLEYIREVLAHSQ